MKILIVSLLRSGDLMMHLPLIRGLQTKYPMAQVCLLTNDSNSGVMNLIPNEIETIFFPREKIIRESRSVDFAITSPIHHLSNLIETLSERKFDIVFNFTHNRISAHICGAISAKMISGLYYDGKSFRGIDSELARQFDQDFNENPNFPHHYVKALGLIHDLPIVLPNETKVGIRFKREERMEILFQFLSSDRKKDYPLSEGVKLLRFVQQIGFSARVLSAPFEAPLLAEYFSSDEIILCSLSELPNKIAGAQALITVDTLQLHIADELRIPSFGIFLGSGNPRKTGSLIDSSISASSNVPCYPCLHSGPCGQKTRICAEQMSAAHLLPQLSEFLFQLEDVNFEKNIRREVEHDLGT